MNTSRAFFRIWVTIFMILCFGHLSLAGECLPPPANLAAWWRATGNAADTAGTNMGVIHGATFDAGRVGQAFRFNGTNSYVIIPSSPELSPAGAFTIEGWVNYDRLTGMEGGMIAMKGTDDEVPADWAISISANRRLRPHAHVQGVWRYFDCNSVLSTGIWHHVAVVYDGVMLQGYLNGVLDGSQAASGTVRTSHHPVKIGAYATTYPVWATSFFSGRIDELSVYSRALSPSELQAIFAAGSAGKCGEPDAPVIVSQPQSVTTNIGATVTFTVAAAGTVPLNYQWTFNEEVVSGATMPTLVLTNVQLSDSGLYAVTITNQYGTAMSSNAVLAVNPILPKIVSQPADQSVVAGSSASFTVVAEGTPPLHYQWSFNGASLDGGTNHFLMIASAQFDDAGIYAVTVTNEFGYAVSSNATLTVNPVLPCVAISNGLVGWWRAEDDATDAVSGTSGILHSVVFAPGKVGRAFGFDGLSSHVQIPSSTALSPTGPFTLEGWVNYDRITGSTGGTIAMKGPDAEAPADWALLISASRKLRPHVYTTSWNYFDCSTTLSTGAWYHVAMVYDGSTLRGYLNGILDGAMSVAGTVRSSTHPMKIGAYASQNAPSTTSFLSGRIDELSLHARALSSNEVHSLFAADAGGKCVELIPPSIVSQPQHQSVTVGANVAFTVGASGSPPLTYQWRLNGSNMLGETSATLALTNVQLAQAGDYSAEVSNEAGSATSSNAVLAVSLPPAGFRIPITNVVSGWPVSVPILLAANGNENAFSFSLNFSTQRLAFSAVTSPYPLFVNTSQTNLGRIGLAVALPADATFPAGTQEVARVTFEAQIWLGTLPTTTAIEFGNSPLQRALTDVYAANLQATYAGGIITISGTDLEGDVSPRPTGNRSLTIHDWVQIGRFAAKLDTPANGDEFQRADCAPRSERGDGEIKVTDWVQAGRYFAQLDPLTAVGGPTSAVPTGVASVALGAGVLSREQGSALREIRVGDTAGIRGVPLSLPVSLNSLGDENAVGFTVAFDPAVFACSSITPGSDAINATLNVNTQQVASGHVGIAIALQSGSTFSTGLRELVKLTLIPVTVLPGDYPVHLDSQIVVCTVSDPLANELNTDYLPGMVVVNSEPTLDIRLEGDDVVLSWPLWAHSFNLQAVPEQQALINWTNVAGAPRTNGEVLNFTLPTSDGTRYFRLRHP
jgi:hypothetical protein